MSNGYQVNKVPESGEISSLLADLGGSGEKREEDEKRSLPTMPPLGEMADWPLADVMDSVNWANDASFTSPRKAKTTKEEPEKAAPPPPSQWADVRVADFWDGVNWKNAPDAGDPFAKPTEETKEKDDSFSVENVMGGFAWE